MKKRLFRSFVSPAQPAGKRIGKALGAIVPALAILALAPRAGAIEPLTTDQLNGYCESYEEAPESPDGITCVSYIQGFIAGAVATDDFVARSVARYIQGNETFIDQFKAVRYGRETPNYGPTYFAEFCIDDPIPLREVVLKVVRDMQDPVYIAEEKLARDAVFRALRQDYACD